MTDYVNPLQCVVCKKVYKELLDLLPTLFRCPHSVCIKCCSYPPVACPVCHVHHPGEQHEGSLNSMRSEATNRSKTGQKIPNPRPEATNRSKTGQKIPNPQKSIVEQNLFQDKSGFKAGQMPPVLGAGSSRTDHGPAVQNSKSWQYASPETARNIKTEHKSSVSTPQASAILQADENSSAHQEIKSWQNIYPETSKGVLASQESSVLPRTIKEIAIDRLVDSLYPLQCGVCKIFYKDLDLLPTLFRCGHSVCIVCWAYNSIACPSCQADHHKEQHESNLNSRGPITTNRSNTGQKMPNPRTSYTGQNMFQVSSGFKPEQKPPVLGAFGSQTDHGPAIKDSKSWQNPPPETAGSFQTGLESSVSKAQSSGILQTDEKASAHQEFESCQNIHSETSSGFLDNPKSSVLPPPPPPQSSGTFHAGIHQESKSFENKPPVTATRFMAGQRPPACETSGTGEDMLPTTARWYFHTEQKSIEAKKAQIIKITQMQQIVQETEGQVANIKNRGKESRLKAAGATANIHSSLLEPINHAGFCEAHGEYLTFWCEKCKQGVCQECVINRHLVGDCHIVPFHHALQEMKLREALSIKRVMILGGNSLAQYRAKHKVNRFLLERHREIIRNLQALISKHQKAVRDLEQQDWLIQGSLAEGMQMMQLVLGSQGFLLKAKTYEEVMDAKLDSQILQLSTLCWPRTDDIWNYKEIMYSQELLDSMIPTLTVLRECLALSANDDVQSHARDFTALSKEDGPAVRYLKHLMQRDHWMELYSTLPRVDCVDGSSSRYVIQGTTDSQNTRISESSQSTRISERETTIWTAYNVNLEIQADYSDDSEVQMIYFDSSPMQTTNSESSEINRIFSDGSDIQSEDYHGDSELKDLPRSGSESLASRSQAPSDADESATGSPRKSSGLSLMELPSKDDHAEGSPNQRKFQELPPCDSERLFNRSQTQPDAGERAKGSPKKDTSKKYSDISCKKSPVNKAGTPIKGILKKPKASSSGVARQLLPATAEWQTETQPESANELDTEMKEYEMELNKHWFKNTRRVEEASRKDDGKDKDKGTSQSNRRNQDEERSESPERDESEFCQNSDDEILIPDEVDHPISQKPLAKGLRVPWIKDGQREIWDEGIDAEEFFYESSLSSENQQAQGVSCEVEKLIDVESVEFGKSDLGSPQAQGKYIDVLDLETSEELKAKTPDFTFSEENAISLLKSMTVSHKNTSSSNQEKKPTKPIPTMFKFDDPECKTPESELKAATAGEASDAKSEEETGAQCSHPSRLMSVSASIDIRKPKESDACKETKDENTKSKKSKWSWSPFSKK